MTTARLESIALDGVTGAGPRLPPFVASALVKYGNKLADYGRESFLSRHGLPSIHSTGEVFQIVERGGPRIEGVLPSIRGMGRFFTDELMKIRNHL